MQFSSAFLLVGENATAKMVWGIVAAAVAGGVALLVLLWLVSVPLYGCAPVPFKTCFARLMRTTAKPKEWSFTRIEVSCIALCRCAGMRSACALPAHCLRTACALHALCMRTCACA